MRFVTRKPLRLSSFVFRKLKASIQKSHMRLTNTHPNAFHATRRTRAQLHLHTHIHTRARSTVMDVIGQKPLTNVTNCKLFTHIWQSNQRKTQHAYVCMRVYRTIHTLLC